MAICLCGQPGGSGGPVIPSLFGLASSGVCPAGALPRPPVSSYLTISPLPRQAEAVCFCGTFRRVAPPRLVSLPGAVPCEVRTFLSRPASRTRAATRPTPPALWRMLREVFLGEFGRLHGLRLLNICGHELTPTGTIESSGRLSEATSPVGKQQYHAPQRGARIGPGSMHYGVPTRACAVLFGDLGAPAGRLFFWYPVGVLS